MFHKPASLVDMQWCVNLQISSFCEETLDESCRFFVHIQDRAGAVDKANSDGHAVWSSSIAVFRDELITRITISSTYEHNFAGYST